MAKTVYLGMIGDIMHPGLINIINEGAKYGDVMILRYGVLNERYYDGKKWRYHSDHLPIMVDLEYK